MQAEQRVRLLRGMQEFVGIVSSSVKIKVAAEFSPKLSTP